MTGSPYILVVDDSAAQAAFLKAVLSTAGFRVETASDGALALERMRHSPPDGVLTDLQMPNMDGLELVQTVRDEFAGIPIVLMTAVGSEQIAAEALRKGAASYVPKLNIEDNISDTMRRVLSLTKVVEHNRRTTDRLAEYSTRLDFEFKLDNDDSLIPPLVQRLQETLAEMELWDEGVRMQIGMALDEALINAMHHGNLEAPSALRDQDAGRPYIELINRRQQEEPYASRKVTFTASSTRQGATFTVQDEGPGFDPGSVPDPTAPENLEKVSGRGLLLIHTFMDDVSHNDAGNAITMTKKA